MIRRYVRVERTVQKLELSARGAGLKESLPHERAEHPIDVGCDCNARQF